MSRKIILISLLLMSLLIFSGCRRESGLANPASEFCEENGGKLEIREDDSGGQVGFCIFSDGSECEEWAYFNSECKPGDIMP
jgi:inhibitor of cysteine peptidase